VIIWWLFLLLPPKLRTLYGLAFGAKGGEEGVKIIFTIPIFTHIPEAKKFLEKHPQIPPYGELKAESEKHKANRS
jgi:hypothetical protein